MLKFTVVLPILLFSAVGFAQTQPFALCGLTFNPGQGGWGVGFSAAGKFEISKGNVSRGGGLQSSSKTGASCGILTGTGSSVSVDVSLFALEGSGIGFDNRCNSTGTIVSKNHLQKTLNSGEFAMIDVKVDGIPMRQLVYLPTPDEAIAAGWFDRACNRLVAGMKLEE